MWNYNDSSHWHECSYTDKSETASHSFVAGICSVCGYKEGSQGLEYILSSNKDSYYVKGIGECTDTDIVIPEYYNGLKITNINSSAFKGNTEIKSVFISKNVSLISGEAFSNCRNLENVVFEEGVTNIAWYAFINCTSLKNVSLPSSLGIIGSNAFKNCTSLTNINIPDKVTALYGTFYGCSSLQKMVK